MKDKLLGVGGGSSNIWGYGGGIDIEPPRAEGYDAITKELSVGEGYLFAKVTDI